jgi:transcriptional regulator with XRE-family HTH domain
MANTALTIPRRLLDEYLSKAAEAMASKSEDLGQRIKVAREDQGWKQKELARAVHVEPMTVSRWERGINTPDLETLRLIAQATHKPQSYFVEERKVAQTTEQLLDDLRQNQEDAIGLLRELVVAVDELKESIRSLDDHFGSGLSGTARQRVPRSRKA